MIGKAQFFIGMLFWVSCHCIHQAYYLLYIFCLPKTNINRNANVCRRNFLPHSKKPPRIENSKPICSAIIPLIPTRQNPQVKKNFGQTTVHIQNTKYNSLSPWYHFSLHYLIIIYFDVGIYFQIPYLTNFYYRGIEWCKNFLLDIICSNFLLFYC